jgi:hypothetical protein
MLVAKPGPVRLKTSVPALFQEIIHNYEQLRLSKESHVVCIDVHRRLAQARKDYMRSAEQYVFGTKNKGKEI